MAYSLIESVGAVSDLPSDSITEPQVISFDHIQLKKELLLCWSQHEMKILPLCFLNAFYLSCYEWFIHAYQNVICLYSSKITDFSPVTCARPFQSFSPPKTHPFLTIDWVKVSLHPINNWCIDQVPSLHFYFFLDILFHSFFHSFHLFHYCFTISA